MGMAGNGIQHAAIGRDRLDHDAGADRQKIDAGQRCADPRIDDDSLVEDAFEHIDDTGIVHHRRALHRREAPARPTAATRVP
jgi:hypothetical protein